MVHTIQNARVDSYKLAEPVAHWQPGTNGYDCGSILLPEGTVEVMMQGDEDHQPLTRLDFVLRGRHYMVTFDKRYSRRGVITVARRVLRDLGA